MEKGGGGETLSILGHIRELRRRLLICVGALLVTNTISFAYARHIFTFLISLVPSSITFIYSDMTEMMLTYFRVAFYMGLAMGLPVIVYEVVMFLRPALTRREKIYLYAVLPAILGLFFLGLLYAWFVFLPPVLNFLIEYQWMPEIGTRIIPMIKIGSYISFTLRSLFWIGLAFELPAVIFFLSRIGILSYNFLTKRWKWISLAIFIFAAIVTPTGNPANQSVSDIILLDFGVIVSGPIFFIYFLSIFLAWLGGRMRAKKQALELVAHGES